MAIAEKAASQGNYGATVFVCHLHKMCSSAYKFDLLHGEAGEESRKHASILYDILGRYITPDDYDLGQNGSTKLLQFMIEATALCTEYEALHTYLLVAHLFCDSRWTHYFHHLRPASQDEWESTLLEAYLDATSGHLVQFIRMLLLKRTTVAALSVAAMDILCAGNFRYPGVSRWMPAVKMFKLRKRARKRLLELQKQASTEKCIEKSN